MTVDTSYQTGVVQIRQNGSLAVISGTTLTVESGGTLRVESGGVLINSGIGVMAVETISSSASVFSNSGITLFGSTATGATYTMAAPTQIGVSKYLIPTVHGATTTSETVTCVGAKIINGTTNGVGLTAGTSVLTFANNNAVHLVSVSLTAWAVIATPAAKIEVSYS